MVCSQCDVLNRRSGIISASICSAIVDFMSTVTPAIPSPSQPCIFEVGCPNAALYVHAHARAHDYNVALRVEFIHRYSASIGTARSPPPVDVEVPTEVAATGPPVTPRPVMKALHMKTM